MSNGTRPRILVVNDDRRLAKSVQGLLNEEGYEVAVAFDGKDAIEVVGRWPADLVLLDLIMPVLDGWGFLAELSKQADRVTPPVLVWSVADGDGLARARQLGAAECLPRETTNPDLLLNAVSRLLRGTRSS